MAVVPDSKVGKIEYFESKGPVWTLNQAAIGLASGDPVALDVKTAAAREAYNAQLAAASAAKAATVAADQAVAALAELGSELIRKIRLKALTNEAVYAIAQVPPPATPS